MFAHHCRACDTRYLNFQSQVTGLVEVEGGFAVSFTCWCGSDQVWLSAGAAAASESAAPEPAATVAA